MAKEAASSSSSQQSTTARSRVREDVRRLILSGELRPGTRLTQQQLAKRFGVAQSVIRESLLELQFSGLVQSVDNLGIFVSDLDTDMLLQAYEVREMLEGMAARLCCATASRTDIKVLTDQAERIYQLGMDDKQTERGALDRDFHHKIITISRNIILARLTEAYHVLGMIVQTHRSHQEIREEHLGMVKAIEENRPEDAESLARQHVALVRQAIQQQITEGKFVPRWVLE